MTGALLLAAWAASVSLVAERSTGRVAVLQGEVVEVWSAGLERQEATLPAPPGRVRLLEFIGGVVAYAFAMPDDGSPARAVVRVEDGIEQLIWPNAGIGERFPGLAARLTADGAGLFQYLHLDTVLREELGLPEDIPEGAGTVATYRFADERVWAIAAADFATAVALAPGDALVATTDGGLLRFRAGAGLLWRRPGNGTILNLLDVEHGQGLLVVGSERGIEVVAVESGERRGEWSRDRIVDAKLLADGRLVAATGGGEVLLVTLAGERPAAAAPLGGLAGGSGHPGLLPCPAEGRPLACLHPTPSGAFLLSSTGWRFLPLPALAKEGQQAPGARPATAAPPSR